MILNENESSRQKTNEPVSPTKAYMLRASRADGSHHKPSPWAMKIPAKRHPGRDKR